MGLISPGGQNLLDCLELRQVLSTYDALALSSRAVAALSHSPPRGSKDLWFSLESFPRGFPTGLSHVHVLGVELRLERQGSAGKTGSSGMD